MVTGIGILDKTPAQALHGNDRRHCCACFACYDSARRLALVHLVCTNSVPVHSCDLSRRAAQRWREVGSAVVNVIVRPLVQPDCSLRCLVYMYHLR
jgi:hypothetical protein